MAFADTSYWVALLSPRESLNDIAKVLTAELQDKKVTLVTSSYIVAEVLDRFSKYGAAVRAAAKSLVDDLRIRTDVVFVEGSPDYVERALQRYEEYKDKIWSFTDCSSVVIMLDLGITDAVTYDSDFEQAYFIAMMRH
ncbi:MAG TPA: PIN domain-containing protein [Candidatus Tumulicola sp.]|jgi:predicted nucleic acid-binding protein